jgi:hypothetical protein
VVGAAALGYFAAGAECFDATAIAGGALLDLEPSV